MYVAPTSAVSCNPPGKKIGFTNVGKLRAGSPISRILITKQAA
jgi:hypothetical protein